ncbi:MAG TPA: PEP/pyruvate-binding domain-containing protein [Anaerolineales bacterium]|nr:PEP/pyruvate-binding domain-containing protein [Anaerolineales bacterium]
MTLDSRQYPRALMIYLELQRYPILASRIRERMRQELIRRRVVTAEALEAEVQEKAVESQQREGLADPLTQEPPEVWSSRLAIIRDHLTDFYFAYNLPHEDFEDLVRQTLAERLPAEDVVLTFHPELAPWDMLFAQGEAYEALDAPARQRIEHHLKEIKVVLTKAMISDHLGYVGVARDWFDMADLQSVRARRIGRGKIGGKAAGLVLAACILRKTGDPDLTSHLRVPRSWFLGADVFYQFIQLNALLDLSNQKYRQEPEIRAAFPAARQRFSEGSFPDEVVEGLRTVVREANGVPLIVRSSSLLEDSFGFSFAGKYESRFCPNQSSDQENLRSLLGAVARVYASVYSPDVLLYRRQMGLLDYDERMAVLIQEVEGRRTGAMFMPDAAGVAFSRNPFRWSPRIDRHAGLVRMVWGLGTRAVEQHAGDYPRLIALSHPDLRPGPDPRRIRHVSQRYVDLIDLEANAFQTVDVSAVLPLHGPRLRWIAQMYREGLVEDLVSRPLKVDAQELIVTLEGLLRRTPFVDRIRRLLQQLESAYNSPVDVEFALLLELDDTGEADLQVCLLQCRPTSRVEAEAARAPESLPAESVLFRAHRLVPDGRVSGVRYVVYLPGEAYAGLGRVEQRKALARAVGRVNQRLAKERFVLLGPGRWGSTNPELGVPVTYGDIYNARALVEIHSGEEPSQPSYGTHFFQDLVEAHIYPLALELDDPQTVFNPEALLSAPNQLARLVPEEAGWSSGLIVVDLQDLPSRPTLELVMDGEAGIAVAHYKTGGE